MHVFVLQAFIYFPNADYGAIRKWRQRIFQVLDPPRQPFTPPISTVLCKILEIDERPRPSVRTSFMDGPYVVVYKKIVCF